MENQQQSNRPPIPGAFSGTALRAAFGHPAWISLAAGLGAFLAYLWLAPPVAGDGDSCELALVLGKNGVAHPTGYPLYVIFGHWFVAAFHRLGATWDYAANAWSALGGGASVGLMHALGMRLVPANAPMSQRARALTALLPVLLFVVNPVWTDVTTLAEVYSWHQAWALGSVLFFVGSMRFLFQVTPPPDSLLRSDLIAC
jgi:hypothetical protein